MPALSEVGIEQVVDVISPSGESFTLGLIFIGFLGFLLVFGIAYRKGWILMKHPIKVTILEARGHDLTVRNRTKGRLIDEDGDVFYRIRKGRMPWVNIDWVPPPDFKFIDHKDHLFLYAPNRDEHHAAIAEIKEKAEVYLAEEGEGDFDLTVELSDGRFKLIPFKISPPTAGWRQDMSTAAKAYWRMGRKDIEKRATIGSWFKEYQGLIAMVVVGMFLLFLFYISWQPLIDNARITQSSVNVQKETMDAQERVLTKLDILLDRLGIEDIDLEEEEKPIPPPGG